MHLENVAFGRYTEPRTFPVWYPDFRGVVRAKPRAHGTPHPAACSLGLALASWPNPGRRHAASLTGRTGRQERTSLLYVPTNRAAGASYICNPVRSRVRLVLMVTQLMMPQEAVAAMDGGRADAPAPACPTAAAATAGAAAARPRCDAAPRGVPGVLPYTGGKGGVAFDHESSYGAGGTVA
jgi:hypothetical protein